MGKNQLAGQIQPTTLSCVNKNQVQNYFLYTHALNMI